jgi:hypothetical protein
MRVLSIFAIILTLCACGASPAPPTPVAVRQGAILPLPALMQAPERWSGRQMILIAPLTGGPTGRVLGAEAIGASGTATGDTTGAIWLADPLPGTIAAKIAPGTVYLKLRGRLSPPGAYGMDARFAYQFSAETVAVLKPERTTLANLADHPRAIDGALLEVSGTLLARTNDALLADKVTQRGLPEANARQIKLREPLRAATLAGLQRSGEVSYGPVTVVGWWQDGVLAPFSLTLDKRGA